MNRQFNPSETIRINRGKLPKPVETSLTLFLTTLTDHADDERITTKPGRVELADTVAGKPIVWILDVTASVNRSLMGDEHLSMSVKSGEESKSSRERRLCVRRLGDCPVGDHLAIVIHLFHNDMLMKTIPELRMTALRATNPRQS